MTDANGDEIFSYTHTLTFGTSSTWSFEQTFKPATTSVSMLAEKTSKPYTMFNGMELQEFSPNTADYTWSAGRAAWLADGKWIDKTGSAGTPAAGDICYISSSDPTGMDKNYWFETTTTEFPATLVMASGSRMIFKSNATVNDLILDNAYLHHGQGKNSYALGGNMTVVTDSTIDIDDGDWRTLQINSVITGSGNLTLLGNGASTATVELSRGYAGYTGKFILNKVNLKLTTTNGCVGAGDLDIPETSQLTLDGPNYGLHYVNNLTGSGPISVTKTSRFDLASSDPQTYSGTISVAANQSMHIGYTISGDSASDVSLPNATVSLASGATLGLIHQSSSSKVSSLTIGTLNGVSGSVVRASGSVNSNGTNYATLTVGDGDFAGVIGGKDKVNHKMRLIKNTDGTLTLSGANTYEGGTTIEGGKIVLAGAGTLGTGATEIGENGTLEFNVADGAEKTVAITSANAVSGAGKVVKNGNGVLKIDNEGYADSFATSLFTVNAGELDFKGDYTGDMIIGPEGVLSPGNSVGTLSVTGNVTVGGTALFEFGPYEEGEGVFDQLFISDGNAFNAGESTIAISFLNADQDAWAEPGSAYQLVANDGFQIGPLDSWLKDNFDGLFTLEGRADGLYLVAAGADPGTGVPEPATWALLILGVIVLLLRKRS